MVRPQARRRELEPDRRAVAVLPVRLEGIAIEGLQGCSSPKASFDLLMGQSSSCKVFFVGTGLRFTRRARISAMRSAERSVADSPYPERTGGGPQTSMEPGALSLGVLGGAPDGLRLVDLDAAGTYISQFYETISILLVMNTHLIYTACA